MRTTRLVARLAVQYGAGRLQEKLPPHSTHVVHPGYMGFIKPSPNPIGLIADFIWSALNQSRRHTVAAPLGLEIRRHKSGAIGKYGRLCPRPDYTSYKSWLCGRARNWFASPTWRTRSWLVSEWEFPGQRLSTASENPGTRRGLWWCRPEARRPAQFQGEPTRPAG